MPALLSWLFEVLASFGVALTVILAGLAVERRRAPLNGKSPSALFNILYLAPASILQKMTAAGATAISGFAIGHTTGGLILLPADGWQIAPAALLYIAAMDLGEYLFHRAQHRIPILWSMHALHHSDPAVNISTSVRHYWLEYFAKSVTIYLIINLIFRPSPAIAFLYWLSALYNYVLHMDVPVGFGPFGLLLNSPQYHRIHHSRLQEHAGCNYAGLFPLYDRLFGTYRPPAPGEFPATGLADGAYPSGPIAALAWPLIRCSPRFAPDTAR